jgi:hypothetical protein
MLMMMMMLWRYGLSDLCLNSVKMWPTDALLWACGNDDVWIGDASLKLWSVRYCWPIRGRDGSWDWTDSFMRKAQPAPAWASQQEVKTGNLTPENQACSRRVGAIGAVLTSDRYGEVNQLITSPLKRRGGFRRDSPWELRRLAWRRVIRASQATPADESRGLRHARKSNGMDCKSVHKRQSSINLIKYVMKYNTKNISNVTTTGVIQEG